MKRKGGEEQESWNHGRSWLRGPMIGKGSFGCVYLATLKKPRSKFSCFPSVMAVKSAGVSDSASLQKEREVLANFNGCSNVIQCFGEEITEGENGEMVYNLLLEYASGGTLADLIKKSNGLGLPESDVKRLTRSVLCGVLEIHKLGYVHCDLKPENILIVRGSDGFVAKIGDFGSVKKGKQSKKRKLDPYLRGTALYMAPETWSDSLQEPPSDIWALGCIVLEMLTGKPAWDKKPGCDVHTLKQQIGFGYELPKIPSGISEEAKKFLKGCLVRKTMFRLTAEMLLDHPFLEGVDGKIELLEEDSAADGIRSLVSASEGDDEDSSIFSDEPLCESDEHSWFSSWSDNDELTSFEAADEEAVGDWEREGPEFRPPSTAVPAPV